MHKSFSRLDPGKPASQSSPNPLNPSRASERHDPMVSLVFLATLGCLPRAVCRARNFFRDTSVSFFKSVSTTALVAITFFSLGLLTLNVHAQSADVQAPTIELEEIENGIAGETQTFTASVTDDQQLVSVILYHRLAGDENYLSTEMMPISGSAVYSASVVITTDDPRDIEYYIQAEDFGGNKALKGFAFDPLTRQISADVVAVATITQPPAATMSRNRKIMWGVLGILALGLIVSQANSDSDDGGGTPATTETPIEIEVNPLEGFSFSF